MNFGLVSSSMRALPVDPAPPVPCETVPASSDALIVLRRYDVRFLVVRVPTRVRSSTEPAARSELPAYASCFWNISLRLLFRRRRARPTELRHSPRDGPSVGSLPALNDSSSALSLPSSGDGSSRCALFRVLVEASGEGITATSAGPDAGYSGPGRTAARTP